MPQNVMDTDAHAIYGADDFDPRPLARDLAPLDPAVVPPEDLSICFGGGDFAAVGARQVAFLRAFADLKPTDRVLDVGCGAGRTAAALTRYLGSGGSYEGFDVFPLGVEWCAEHVTPRYPDFRFQSVEVFNKTYNPYAATLARDLRFPYPDASFDVAVLNSVFTHMLPEDYVNYVGELARVLAPGGRAFVTYFLLDDACREAAAAGRTTPAFPHAYGSFRVEDPANMEDAVAYEERFVRAVHASAGLEVTRVRPGRWRGIHSRHVQDQVYAARK